MRLDWCPASAGAAAVVIARRLPGPPPHRPAHQPRLHESLAGWLNGLAALPVAIAADGTPAGSGVWIAPKGAHLKLAATGRLHLDTRTVAGRHRPSGDVLFESISTAAGALAVAVVLTGMGSDGAAGAMEVRRRGGLVIAQDEETSAIFGMPKATIDGGADLVLGPDEIAACLGDLRREQLPWPP